MEQWKQTHIRPDYEVSNLGRLRRIKRSKKYIKKYNIELYSYIDGMNNGKYIQVFIRPNKKGKSKIILLHRLIAETFIANPNNKEFVNHKDGNKLNNRVDNLEWVTHKENCIHRELTGLGNKNRNDKGRYI